MDTHVSVLHITKQGNQTHMYSPNLLFIVLYIHLTQHTSTPGGEETLSSQYLRSRIHHRNTLLVALRSELPSLRKRHPPAVIITPPRRDR